MSSVAELVPERFAELIRPAINRVQRSVRDRALTAGSAGLPRRYGMPSARLVDELRNVLPRGPLPTTAFPLAAPYEPAEVVQGQGDALVSAGWLVPVAAGLALGDPAARYLDPPHHPPADATA